jgi:hypothetical protein
LEYLCETKIIAPPYKYFKQIADTNLFLYAMNPAIKVQIMCDNNRDDINFISMNGTGIAVINLHCTFMNILGTQFKVNNIIAPENISQVILHASNHIGFDTTMERWLLLYVTPEIYNYIIERYNNGPESTYPGVPLKALKSHYNEAIMHLHYKSSDEKENKLKSKTHITYSLRHSIIIIGTLIVFMVVFSLISYACNKIKRHNNGHGSLEEQQTELQTMTVIHHGNPEGSSHMFNRISNVNPTNLLDQSIQEAERREVINACHFEFGEQVNPQVTDLSEYGDVNLTEADTTTSSLTDNNLTSTMIEPQPAIGQLACDFKTINDNLFRSAKTVTNKTNTSTINITQSKVYYDVPKSSKIHKTITIINTIDMSKNVEEEKEEKMSYTEVVHKIELLNKKRKGAEEVAKQNNPMYGEQSHSIAPIPFPRMPAYLIPITKPFLGLMPTYENMEAACSHTDETQNMQPKQNISQHDVSLFQNPSQDIFQLDEELSMTPLPISTCSISSSTTLSDDDTEEDTPKSKVNKTHQAEGKSNNCNSSDYVLMSSIVHTLPTIESEDPIVHIASSRETKNNK